MIQARKLGSTTYPIVFLLVDSNNHVTGKTGLTNTPVVTISKNGAGFGAAGGAVSELGYGWYALAGDATDRNTLGSLAIHVAIAGADPCDVLVMIVDYDLMDTFVVTSVAISSTVAAAVSTGNLAIEAGLTFRQTVTSTLLGDLSTATKVWLAIKGNAREIDSASLIFIEKTDGLTVLKGEVYATIANGSLTISGSSGAWSIAAFLDESVTDDLFLYGGTYVAEIKALIGGDTYSVWRGQCIVSVGIVRAIA